MADAGACRRAEKKDPGSYTRKDMLIGMMTGFVQNIEFSYPFPVALSRACSERKAAQERPVRLSETALRIFTMKSEKIIRYP